MRTSRERFESIGWFMGSFHLQSWTRIGTMNLLPRARVLDCARPLALFGSPGLLKPKRQWTGAVQNLAVLRKFMGRESATTRKRLPGRPPQLP